VEVDVEVDMDAEGEAEGEAEENGDDNALYCFCQEKSWGEMIGCDNQECRFEWVSLGLGSHPFRRRADDTNPGIQFNLLNSTRAVPPQVCQARSSSSRDLVLSRLRGRTRPRGQQRETQTETEGEEKVARIGPAVLWLLLRYSLVSMLSVVSCPKSCILCRSVPRQLVRSGLEPSCLVISRLLDLGEIRNVWLFRLQRWRLRSLPD
jgi:hypothetical protein